MNKKKTMIIILSSLFMLLFAACTNSNDMKDGYYTAETKDFENGWKEYVCVLVKNGNIISIDYNAKNESGYVKAWDGEYMQLMNSYSGTYPTEYTREYSSQVLESQDPLQIDSVSGATHSGQTFTALMKAVSESAKAGDSSIAIVDTGAE